MSVFDFFFLFVFQLFCFVFTSGTSSPPSSAETCLSGDLAAGGGRASSTRSCALRPAPPIPPLLPPVAPPPFRLPPPEPRLPHVPPPGWIMMASVRQPLHRQAAVMEQDSSGIFFNIALQFSTDGVAPICKRNIITPTGKREGERRRLVRYSAPRCPVSASLRVYARCMFFYEL